MAGEAFPKVRFRDVPGEKKAAEDRSHGLRTEIARKKLEIRRDAPPPSSGAALA